MAIVSELREFRGLMEISLDGVRWLRVQKKHFQLRPVQLGSILEPETYLDSLAAVQLADCYEAALTMLDQAAQSSGGLQAKLVRKGFVEAAACATVERLVSNGLIDDQRYAERIAQAHLNKPVGAYALRRKLLAKRLDEEAVEAALESFDEEQQASACRQAAEKLWRKYGALPPREGRAKLSQALARRGFGWEAVRSAVEEIASGADSWED